MIVVLADDLSGAAELAGAALALGLTAEVQTKFSQDTTAQVVCVDTDSRSLPATEAARVVGKIATKVARAKPEWIYKKCDSVLRGNVLTEIRSIMAATGQPRATLVSANPTRGRIIYGGDCFVNGEPLHTTAFANDPEHPRRTSRVAELLGGDLSGVTTPDAETSADLERHAKQVDATTLPAGGVEFFTALLHQNAPTKYDTSVDVVAADQGSWRGPMLIVCGSAAAWAKGREAQCVAYKVAIEPMPRTLLANSADAVESAAWAKRIAEALRSGRTVMAAIGSAELHPSPAALAGQLANAVANAVQQYQPKAICAEGGATAAAVARALGWIRFSVGRQIAGGVVELSPVADDAPPFVIKVGSYDWPESVWPH